MHGIVSMISVYYLNMTSHLKEEHLYANINPFTPIKYSEDSSRTVIHNNSSSLEQTLWLFSKIIHILLHFSATSNWATFVICDLQKLVFLVLCHFSQWGIMRSIKGYRGLKLSSRENFSCSSILMHGDVEKARFTLLDHYLCATEEHWEPWIFI